jgi:hypothetical protein
VPDSYDADGSAEVAAAPAAPPAERPDLEQTGFWRVMWPWLVAGAVVRLALIPFTSDTFDDFYWYQVSARAAHGLHLYALPGFSYPPLWGAFLVGIGRLAAILHIGPTSLATSNSTFSQLSFRITDFAVPIVTPLYLVMFKSVLFLADLATTWLVWRTAQLLGASRRGARIAAICWWLSPLAIIESAVHGAFDVSVGLFLLAAVVAALEDRLVLAGAAVALGALAKIEPVFAIPLFLAFIIWPPSGEPSSLAEAAKAVGRFLLGGALATIVVLAPVAAAGETSAMVADIFTRTGNLVRFGGVGLGGLVRALGLNGFQSWARTAGRPIVSRVNEAVEVFMGAGMAILWAVRPQWRTKTNLVGGLALLALFVAMVIPLDQPQYLVWMLPLVCVFAAWSKAVRLWTFLLGLAISVFYVVDLGPFGLMTQLSTATHWLSALSVANSIRAYNAAMPGDFSGPWVGLARGVSVCAVIVSAVALTFCVVRHHWTRRFDPAAADVGAVELELKTTGPRRLQLGALGLAVISLLVWLPGRSPRPLVRVSLTAGSNGSVTVPVQVAGGTWSRVQVAAFPVSTLPAIDQVDIYLSTTEPVSGSSIPNEESVVSDVRSVLKVRVPHWRVTTINQLQMQTAMADTAQAPHTAIVVASGVLPPTVWTSSRDAVRPWVEAGGTLVFAGNAPGDYEVQDGTKLVKTPTDGNTTPSLLGAHRATSRLGWAILSRTPTPAARALELMSPGLHAAPEITMVSDLGGRLLGYTGDGAVSIATVPAGKGTFILFGGMVLGPQTSYDIAQILTSGIYLARGQPAFVTLPPGGKAVLTLNTGGSTSVVVVGFSTDVEESNSWFASVMSLPRS